MDDPFDAQAAKKFLEERESRDREQRESDRPALKQIVEEHLKQLFTSSHTEVYIVGSLIQPYMFYPHSDIDIVLKNFEGDRFALWAQLERAYHRNVEVILFEHCHFQEHVVKTGYRVL